eukprot:180999-Pleurochrysis_carterae.AAC.4
MSKSERSGMASTRAVKAPLPARLLPDCQHRHFLRDSGKDEYGDDDVKTTFSNHALQRTPVRLAPSPVHPAPSQTTT